MFYPIKKKQSELPIRLQKQSKSPLKKLLSNYQSNLQCSPLRSKTPNRGNLSPLRKCQQFITKSPQKILTNAFITRRNTSPIKSNLPFQSRLEMLAYNSNICDQNTTPLLSKNKKNSVKYPDTSDFKSFSQLSSNLKSERNFKEKESNGLFSKYISDMNSEKKKQSNQTKNPFENIKISEFNKKRFSEFEEIPVIESVKGISSQQNQQEQLKVSKKQIIKQQQKTTKTIQLVNLSFSKPNQNEQENNFEKTKKQIHSQLFVNQQIKQSFYEEQSSDFKQLNQILSKISENKAPMKACTENIQVKMSSEKIKSELEMNPFL